MAERNGSALRRRLRSAERLSDRAIARGSFKEILPFPDREHRSYRSRVATSAWSFSLGRASFYLLLLAYFKNNGFEQIADTSANGQQPARMAQHRIPS